MHKVGTGEFERPRIGAHAFDGAGIEDVIEGALVHQHATSAQTIGRDQATVFDTQRAGIGFNFDAPGAFARRLDGAGVEDLAADGGRGIVVTVQNDADRAFTRHVDQASVGNIPGDGGAMQVNTLAPTDEGGKRCRCRRGCRTDRAGVDHTAANDRLADLHAFVAAIVHRNDTGLLDVTRDRTGAQVLRTGPVHRVQRNATDGTAIGIQRNVRAVDQRALDVGIGDPQPRSGRAVLIDHLGGLPGEHQRLIVGFADEHRFACAKVDIHRQHLGADCADHDCQQAFLELLALHF